MNKCKVCGATEESAEFYESIKAYCKEHWKERVRLNRSANLDYYIQYDRNRGRRGTIVETRQYRKNNPEKYKAHSVISYALKASKITKLPCFSCGNEKVEAHHPDYSSPLDVVWLCSACHKKAHAVARKAA